MKKFIKVLAVILALSMIAAFAACTGNNEETTAGDETTQSADAAKYAELKVGFIYLHDQNSTYDKNFMDAAKQVCQELGVQYVEKTNIPESADCLTAALDLADSGCDIVFADSFGHEQFMAQAAEEFPNVQFCHATGTTAHTLKLDNFHNAFASIYEGRYLAGIAAGMKLNEMIEAGDFTAEEAKIGYVGAYTYAEVVSGYTSFYLGVKSVCPTVTMEVQFTGSWYDETLEKEAANLLISRGCKLISQHADSMGAPTACETAGIPNVSYNGSTLSACPETFIVSSRIDWSVYYKYMIDCVVKGEAIADDWCEGIESGAVVLTEVNEAVAAKGTVEAIEAAEKKLIAGELHVFDTSTFTVEGSQLTSYMADVDTDANYEKDTEVIADGHFQESKFRSAPYFDLSIDGITTLNSKF